MYSLPTFLRLLALSAFLAASIPRAEALLLYWAGSGGDVATAGGGTWDPNTSVNWRDSTPTGTSVKWTNNGTAIFQGSNGGAVSVPSFLSVEAIQFAAGAGSFVFTNSGSMNIVGAGISSESVNDQNFTFQSAILSFSGSASAGTGTQSARIRLTINGITTFADNSTAGKATITNNGEMRFSNQSSAGTSALTNNSLLIFEGSAKSGAAAITNRSQLTLQDDAHDFATASFVNQTNGSIDISAVTTVGGVAFGALTAAADSILLLGTNRLTVGALNLTDAGEIAFDLGATAKAKIVVTNSILGNPTAGGFRISVFDTGGLVAGQNFTLIDWTGASSVLDVQETDFALQPLPTGFSGTLKLQGQTLVLEVLPEPGALVSMLFGAVGLLSRRLRPSRR